MTLSGQFLPTPTVIDMGNNKTLDEWEAWTDEQRDKHGNGNGHGASLAIEALRILPTPTVADQFTANLKSTQQSDGSLHSVSLAQIVNRHDLLPTVMTTESHHGDYPSSWNRNTPQVAALVMDKNKWGRFEPAIRQWETINGPAPAPTQPDGTNGAHRLSPKFTEWMMGLPTGWITDIDITRNEQLKACGNGVVPQQAALALKQLLKGTEYER